VAHCIARFAMYTPGADSMWDELAAAAWIDPTLITRHETRYMEVDLDRGAGYGSTLTWTENHRPNIAQRTVEVQVDLDLGRFYEMFVGLMTAATPGH
jgi:purine nucleosidase